MDDNYSENQLSFEDQDIINISYPRVKNILESLLFVTKKPITVDEIRKVLRVDRGLIERSLHELIAEYSGKGLIVSKIAGGFQLVTSPENAKFVDKLLKSPIETTLSQAALEALAIVSYKQPVTRLDIENIRGVASDGVMQTLLEKRLIAEIGRGSGLGRPILYGTTVEFLRHFGLKELSDLPVFPKDELGLDAYRNVLPEEKGNPVVDPRAVSENIEKPQINEESNIQVQGGSAPEEKGPLTTGEDTSQYKFSNEQ